MEWKVGEIGISGPVGAEDKDAMEVRIIHVAADKIIAVPYIDMENPMHQTVMKLAPAVGVNPTYAQCSFDPKTGLTTKGSSIYGVWYLKKKQHE